MDEGVRENPTQVQSGWDDPKVHAIKGSFVDKVDKELDMNDDGVTNTRKSFVNVVNSDKPPSKVNFRTLFNTEQVDMDSDFVLPIDTIKVFASSAGVEQVLQQGPWMIRGTPIILNKWTQNLSLSKDGVTKVPVRVKMHKVPIVAYLEDGLSLIGSQIGNPIMLDAFTSAKYVDTWGRIGYACALIEVSAEKELKQVVTMAVPLEKGSGECEVGESSEGNSNDVIFEEPDSNHVESESKVEELHVGLNRAPKQSEVRQVVNENHLSVCAILESHVNLSMLSKVRSKVFRSWDWTSNASLCLQGCRIILGWNLDVVTVMVLSQSDQAIHLGIHKNVVRNMPWILMGDFNMALNMEDIYAGSSRMNLVMCEFKDCVANIEVMDINSSGLHFTWNQKPKGGNGILKKLDQIMGNMEFLDIFPGAYVLFQPYQKSDHSPANVDVAGHSMYKVVSKMKVLKKPLRKLLHEHGNLHDRVSKLINELDEVQKALDLTPADPLLREEEAVYVYAFNDAKLDEEIFLKQKATVEWLDVEITGSKVPKVFVSHYEQFLGSSIECHELNVDGLFSNQVSDMASNNMIRAITDEEIRASMFDIGDDRALGPDGYTFVFFKKGWNIVGQDVCNVVLDFFSNGQLLKEVNHNFLALIPKVSTPIIVNDYHPISCCNVIYKCISKILTNRIIEGIKELVSENQSAFVPGRRISDNILITQELMHNYHRNRGPPRCAFKVDIQKAYDTVDWCFLENILIRFGFHAIMVKWIMACVSSASFSLSINGNIHGFFKGKRDDLFIFARGDVESARVIMDSLDEFKKTSGLLPVKYLGVPLISLRLLNKDCKILVEKAKNRIEDWKNKSLSLAERLQLCKSVISSMHVYWASVLIIPKGRPLMTMWCSDGLVSDSSGSRICVPRNSFPSWVGYEKVRRSPEEIRDITMVTVCLKLLTFRFKNTAMALSLWHRHNLASEFSLLLEVNVVLQPHSIVL
ncbi:hypothetical protein Tco_0567149 [Tanacetum coccineum]